MSSPRFSLSLDLPFPDPQTPWFGLSPNLGSLSEFSLPPIELEGDSSWLSSGSSTNDLLLEDSTASPTTVSTPNSEWSLDLSVPSSPNQDTDKRTVVTDSTASGKRSRVELKEQETVIVTPKPKKQKKSSADTKLPRHAVSRARVSSKLDELRSLIQAGMRDTKADVLHKAVEVLKKQEATYAELLQQLEARRQLRTVTRALPFSHGLGMPFIFENASIPLSTMLHKTVATGTIVAEQSINAMAVQLGGYKSKDEFYSIPALRRHHPSEYANWPSIHKHLTTKYNQPITFTKHLRHAQGFWFPCTLQAWSYPTKRGIRVIFTVHAGVDHVDEISEYGRRVLAVAADNSCSEAKLKIEGLDTLEAPTFGIPKIELQTC